MPLLGDRGWRKSCLKHRQMLKSSSYTSLGIGARRDEVDKSCRKNGYPWTFRRMLTTPGSRMTDLSARKSEIRPLKLGDRGGVDGLRVQR